MNILLATSEAVPFAKTGGLADVCGALPGEIARLGQPVTLMLPAYRSAREAGLPLESTGVQVNVPIGSKTVTGQLLSTRLPDSDARVYLVEQDEYYDRPELYRSGNADYVDNCERYVFFSRAVLEAIRLLDLKTDLIHANDWQTSLIPAYLKIEYRGVPGYEQIATLLTIHNMAYQGQFWHWDMLLTGLDWKYFNWQQMEFYGKLNLLKTGLVFADAINTVSPQYAEEIQTTDQGCGLEGVLRHRRHVLSGIINGVDYRVWNPATDPHIAQTYGPQSVDQGKSVCKAALQSELGLAVEPRTPLVGLVGRLVDQKGIDLVAELAQDWAPTADVQWVILGTGEPKYEQLFAKLAERFPQKFSATIGYSDPLAHRIEAGADMFLMPSRFEPCGLNQLYSLKYGTVPVVRATGGLANTITTLDETTLADKSANGFSFAKDDTVSLAQTLNRALNTYRQQDIWSVLMQSGMAQDWSWQRSAQQYIELYDRTLASVRQAIYS